MKVFDICMEVTFSVCNQTTYHQIFGCPQGFLLLQLLACMVMQVIEQNAIEIFYMPSSMWVRYVDDVYSIVEINQIAVFHDHFYFLFQQIQQRT